MQKSPTSTNNQYVKQTILKSILTGHEKVTAIRLNTRLSPITVQNYLAALAKAGYISGYVRKKRGKSLNVRITESGRNWLLSSSFVLTLQSLSTMTEQLRNTDNREIFVTMLKKRVLEAPNEKRVGEFLSIYQPFRDLLKRIIELQIFLSSTIFSNPLPHQPEYFAENYFFAFSPGMRDSYSWISGEHPEIEGELRKNDQMFKVFLANIK